jgi:stearoyl-CoA desaturase (delta-9 desaturase)
VSIESRATAVVTCPPVELSPAGRSIHWSGALAFIVLHAGTIAGMILWPLTASATALGLALFWIRTFALTAGYHRYFSHRTFKTSRSFQLLLALLGCSTFQQGPLWWAGHHRHHHRNTDRPDDVHSPRQQGFLWAHVGWVFSYENEPTRMDLVKDLARYPELVWLDRHHRWPAYAVAAGAWTLAGMPGLVWGFLLSTLVLFQTTFAVNSLAHGFGRRRYDNDDDSRNNWWIALLTFGEGWHNNHHRYPASARQGFFWWELDVSYLILAGLARLGVVWDLREPPRKVLEEARRVPIRRRRRGPRFVD